MCGTTSDKCHPIDANKVSSILGKLFLGLMPLLKLRFFMSAKITIVNKSINIHSTFNCQILLHIGLGGFSIKPKPEANANKK